jgi:hypothetical protein
MLKIKQIKHEKIELFQSYRALFMFFEIKIFLLGYL